MYEYHVLSNYDFVKILVYAICGMVILRAFAAYLGRKDGRIAKQKKSVFRKVVPWGLLCILFSELSLLIYRLLHYPWSTVPQPSQISIAKEMQYGADSIILWGWANDSQLTVLSSLAGTALWLFWTIYAFKYKPSDTSKWKKSCKILTYIIISVTILDFNIHSFLDFVWWTIVFIIVIVLLRISSVKVKHQETDDVFDQIPNTNIPKISVSKMLDTPNQDSASIIVETSESADKINKRRENTGANDKNKLPLLRRVFIVLLFVAELTAMSFLFNIDKVINYNLEPVTDDFSSYAEEHFGLNALPKDEFNQFVNKNKELISKHNYDPIFINRLYHNKLYIDFFGKNAFYKSIREYGDKAFEQRESRMYAYLYPKWKYEYSKYINLSEKENQERKSSTYILYSILLFCGMCIYLLSYRKIGYSNGQIHGLIVYNIICEILSLIIASLALILDQDTINNSYGLWALLFFPSVVICPIMISFLSKRTEENFQSQVLIPKYFTRTDIVNSELSKRIFLALISYPLFYIVPIPYGGIFVFIFYIIPMAIVFAIVNILLWIAKGRKIDKNFQTSKSENSTARIYCRFCGKLIDADSAYCRYCGKKQ